MTLHPFIAAMLSKLAEAEAPALSDGTTAEARALVTAGRAALGPGPDVARSSEVTVPTRNGSISARLLVPHGDVIGLVVYLHGGGWVVGAVDDFDMLAREFASRSGCAVLLPEYRLAPEHPFPSALEDAVDVLLWHEGLDRPLADLPLGDLPLVVAGDSAGANLATVAARILRGRVDPVLQVLLYPVVDCDFDTASYREFAEGLPLTRRDMRWFFGHYAPAHAWVAPEVSPLRAENLEGAPPALIVTAEYDVLRSEGEAYAERLAAAGAKVTTWRYPGVTHGFLRLHNHVDTARDAIHEVAAAMAQAVTVANPR